MRCKELINDDKGGGCLSGHWGRFRLARLLICLTVLCCREGYALFASDVLGEYSAILRYRLNLRHFSELGGLPWNCRNLVRLVPCSKLEE